MNIKDELTKWLGIFGLEDSDRAYFLVVMGLIILISLVIHFILHGVVLRFLDRSAEKSELVWRRALYGRKLFTHLALTLQGIIIFIQARIWLDPDSLVLPAIEVLTHLWVLLYSLLTLFSLLDTLEDLSKISKFSNSLPLRGIFQSIKLIAAIIVIIFCVALLIGKSPLILFSGLGAMTAVLLLIFKDPLLGLVAGIQLSANKMLAVNDWLEMPKYGADGDVIEINLTTVKVRNWDKTITTIPAYALISDSFKNWRGMTEAGGRRIKRAIYIDTTSVHFLTPDEIVQLRKAKLLSEYIESKVKEMETFNKEQDIENSPTNGRRLTNLGTFRAYLTAYLKSHKDIHKEMTLMVRQLDPGTHGLPLEVYAFSSNINWTAFEGIQADIFDHIFAVIAEFNLRIHQSPTGNDLQQLGKSLQSIPKSSE